MVENTWHSVEQAVSRSSVWITPSHRHSLRGPARATATQPASTTTWQSFEKDRGEGIHMLGHSLRDVEEQVVDPLQRCHLNTTTSTITVFSTTVETRYYWRGTQSIHLKWAPSTGNMAKMRKPSSTLHAIFLCIKNAQNFGSAKIFSKNLKNLLIKIVHNLSRSYKQFGIIQA